MVVTLRTICRSCAGYGHTWEPSGQWLDCAPCGGTGRMDVSVRDSDDTLDDHIRLRMDPQANTDTRSDSASANGDTLPYLGDSDSDEEYSCYCDPHTDSCVKPAPTAQRGADEDPDQSRSGRAAAAAFCGHPDPGNQGDGLAGSSERMPTNPRRSLRSEPGEGAMNRGLEQWR